MENELEIQSIVDKAVRDVTKRLAGIDLDKAEQWVPEENGEVASLYTATTGSYEILIICHAEVRLLRFIAEKMKRRPITDSAEVEMYAKEYFNILCGHIVSTINRVAKTSARFSIPHYHRGVYTVQGKAGIAGIVLEVSYQSHEGTFQLQSIGTSGSL